MDKLNESLKKKNILNSFSDISRLRILLLSITGETHHKNRLV